MARGISSFATMEEQEMLEQEDEARAARLAAMRAEVRAGIDQAERGELLDGEEAIARVRKRSAAKRRAAGE